jgi:hypothetical protein
VTAGVVGSIDAKVRDEAAAMLAAVEHVDGHLDWDTFAAGWRPGHCHTASTTPHCAWLSANYGRQPRG